MMKNVNEHAKANEKQEIEKDEKNLCFILVVSFPRLSRYCTAEMFSVMRGLTV